MKARKPRTHKYVVQVVVKTTKELTKKQARETVVDSLRPVAVGVRFTVRREVDIQ